MSLTDTGTTNNPKVYSVERLPDYLVAEGTDGNLYVVPSEPGGWLRRNDYRGEPDELKPLPLQDAETQIWVIYGDIGSITVATG